VTAPFPSVEVPASDAPGRYLVRDGCDPERIAAADGPTPKRVQMTRNKPWRADNPDAVIVDRRTKWGNPYKPERVTEFDVLADGFNWYVYDTLGGETFRRRSAAVAHAVKAYAFDFHFRLDRVADLDLGELRGRDLACWCPLDQPCHADVLLELANTPRALNADGEQIATGPTFPVLPPEHCTRCGCPDNHHTEDHTGRTYCHCLQCPGHTSTGPA